MQRMTPIQHLQRAAVMGTFHSGQTVSGDTLEGDGRKRTAAIKRLIKAGLISGPEASNEMHARYFPSEACYDGIDSHPLNLLAIWGHLHEHDSSDRLKRPWVRLDDLTTEQLKTVSESKDYLFCVVDTYPFQYTHACWMENSEEVPGKTGVGYWEGPMNLAAAQKRLPEIRDQFRAQHPRSGPFEIVVTTLQLAADIEKQEFEMERERLLRCNICWALVELGVMDKSQVFDDQSDASENSDRGKFTTGERSTLFHSYTNLGDDPEMWGTVLTEQIGKITTRIGELKAMQALLLNLQESMAQKGGWPKFVGSFRAKLEEYLNSRGEEEEA